MLSIQKPRGSFNLELLDGLTHSYKNIQNVIAKLESGNGANHALLVNCHFDSVPQSAGRSDCQFIFDFFCILMLIAFFV